MKESLELPFPKILSWLTCMAFAGTNERNVKQMECVESATAHIWCCFLCFPCWLLQFEHV
jgi:hypothetical protein